MDDGLALASPSFISALRKYSVMLQFQTEIREYRKPGSGREHHFHGCTRR